MQKIQIPKSAEDIISKLKEFGYDGYIVGGCVRDSLLGRAPNDFDITTDATPDEIKQIFKKTVDTGIAHGTVTVIEGNETYEVTTYRIDGEYLDNRHPVSVSFTKKLLCDLSRRDFTVNALAYNSERGVVDEVGGMADLSKKLIRTVGDPHLRFSEDALRVLRGIRFSSVLDFDIEKNTAQAIRACCSKLENVSKERIYTEWIKLLSGVRAYSVLSEFREVIEVFLPELRGIALPPEEAFMSLPCEYRQISLFVPLGKACFASAMKRMKTDAKTRIFGSAVLDSVPLLLLADEGAIKEFLINREDAVSLAAAQISEALGMAKLGTHAVIKALIDEDAPRRTDQLAIGGDDVTVLGYSGRAVGEILQKLLRCVALGKIENTKQALVAYIKQETDNGI